MSSTRRLGKVRMDRSHRHWPRIETDARVDYVGPNEVLLDHRILNISLGGMALRVPTVEPVGTRVDLSISFPELDATFETRGEVVWVRREEPKELGIRFLCLGAREQAVLRRFLYVQKQRAA